MDQRRKTVSSEDILDLVSDLLANKECLAVMESIASSKGGEHIKWRFPSEEEKEILIRFRKSWFIDKGFGWPPSVLIATKIGLYFPVSIWLLRGEYEDVRDPKLRKYLDDKCEDRTP